MKAGKPSGAVLSRSVIKQLKKDVSAQIPRSRQLDFGTFSLGDNQVVLSSQAVAYPVTNTGRFGVMSALNNILCSGAKPQGVMLTILFPTTGAEQDLRALVKDADSACAEMGISVLGGHTEIVSGLKEAMLLVTGVGAVAKEKIVFANQAVAGMDLVLAGYAGLAGTAVVAQKKEAELLQRYSAPFLEKAKHFDEPISIEKSVIIAMNHGVAAMHDVSLGGVYGCLWELAESSNVGLSIDLKAIPIKQETVEICEFFDLNPYKLFGAGAVLIATNSGEQLVEKLTGEGIAAAVIGHTTNDNDRILITGEEKRFLESTQSDELYKL